MASGARGAAGEGERTHTASGRVSTASPSVEQPEPIAAAAYGMGVPAEAGVVWDIDVESGVHLLIRVTRSILLMLASLTSRGRLAPKRGRLPSARSRNGADGFPVRRSSTSGCSHE